MKQGTPVRLGCHQHWRVHMPLRPQGIWALHQAPAPAQASPGQQTAATTCRTANTTTLQDQHAHRRTNPPYLYPCFPHRLFRLGPLTLHCPKCRPCKSQACLHGESEGVCGSVEVGPAQLQHPCARRGAGAFDRCVHHLCVVTTVSCLFIMRKLVSADEQQTRLSENFANLHIRIPISPKLSAYLMLSFIAAQHCRKHLEYISRSCIQIPLSKAFFALHSPQPSYYRIAHRLRQAHPEAVHVRKARTDIIAERKLACAPPGRRLDAPRHALCNACATGKAPGECWASIGVKSSTYASHWKGPGPVLPHQK